MVSIGLLVALIVLMYSHTAADVSFARCEFIPTDALNQKNSVKGSLSFSRENEGMVMYGNVEGLRPNSVHGLAIHSFASRYDDALTDLTTAVGEVYNPGNAPHGCLKSNRRRVGDLGNLPKSDGSGKVSIPDSNDAINRMVQLAGEWSVVGRAIVIYEGEDQCKLGDDAPAGKAYATCNIVIVHRHL
jgi:Cu-Zn family superoxide dismutase